MKARIVIIEDDVSIRRFLDAALDNAGYEVVDAATGGMGLNQIMARIPDLIVLDLGLPDMDGMDVIRRIREWSQVPILVLSARDREGDKVEALNEGADDYLHQALWGPRVAGSHQSLSSAVGAGEGPAPARRLHVSRSAIWWSIWLLGGSSSGAERST